MEEKSGEDNGITIPIIDTGNIIEVWENDDIADSKLVDAIKWREKFMKHKLALKRLIKSNNLDLVLIVEPWMDFIIFIKKCLSQLDLKPFAFSNKIGMLPNMWCLCKFHLDPIVLFSDDQHVAFSINLKKKTFWFSYIYAFNDHLHIRYLWNKQIHIIQTLPSALLEILIL